MRVIIFANGILPDNQAIHATIGSADLLIAANGGARHCLAMGLTPAFVVGDFDSLSPDQKDLLQARGSHFVVHPRLKDQTDLELALDHAISLGAKEIYFVGLMGGRLDQTIANLLLITRSNWDAAQLILINGFDVGYLMRSGDDLEIIGQVGDIVSLIPLSTVVDGIITIGLRWSLEKASLELGTTLGISNELSNETANIRIDQGKLLVVHNKQNV